MTWVWFLGPTWHPERTCSYGLSSELYTYHDMHIPPTHTEVYTHTQVFICLSTYTHMHAHTHNSDKGLWGFLPSELYNLRIACYTAAKTLCSRWVLNASLWHNDTVTPLRIKSQNISRHLLSGLYAGWVQAALASGAALAREKQAWKFLSISRVRGTDSSWNDQGQQAPGNGVSTTQNIYSQCPFQWLTAGWGNGHSEEAEQV